MEEEFSEAEQLVPLQNLQRPSIFDGLLEAYRGKNVVDLLPLELFTTPEDIGGEGRLTKVLEEEIRGDVAGRQAVVLKPRYREDVVFQIKEIGFSTQERIWMRNPTYTPFNQAEFSAWGPACEIIIRVGDAVYMKGIYPIDLSPGMFKKKRVTVKGFDVYVNSYPNLVVQARLLGEFVHANDTVASLVFAPIVVMYRRNVRKIYSGIAQRWPQVVQVPVEKQYRQRMGDYEVIDLERSQIAQAPRQQGRLQQQGGPQWVPVQQQQEERRRGTKKGGPQWEAPQQQGGPQQQWEEPRQQQRGPQQQWEEPRQQQRGPQQQRGGPQQQRGPQQQWEEPRQQQRGSQQRGPQQQWEEPRQQQRGSQQRGPQQQWEEPRQQRGPPPVPRPNEDPQYRADIARIRQYIGTAPPPYYPPEEEETVHAAYVPDKRPGEMEQYIAPRQGTQIPPPLYESSSSSRREGRKKSRGGTRPQVY